MSIQIGTVRIEDDQRGRLVIKKQQPGGETLLIGI